MTTKTRKRLVLLFAALVFLGGYADSNSNLSMLITMLFGVTPTDPATSRRAPMTISATPSAITSFPISIMRCTLV